MRIRSIGGFEGEGFVTGQTKGPLKFYAASKVINLEKTYLEELLPKKQPLLLARTNTFLKSCFYLVRHSKKR